MGVPDECPLIRAGELLLALQELGAQREEPRPHSGAFAAWAIVGRPACQGMPACRRRRRSGRGRGDIRRWPNAAFGQQTPLRLARRPEHPQLAHPNSAISRLSTRPPGRQHSTSHSERAPNKGLGTAPEYEHDHPRDPPGRPDRPASRNHNNHHHQPDNGQQPLPLDNRSSI